MRQWNRFHLPCSGFEKIFLLSRTAIEETPYVKGPELLSPNPCDFDEDSE